MAVRIRLLRMGKIRNPQYRIVVADSRTKRDGKAIEFIGIYHPKEEPSLIEVKSDRVQHWLTVGAQPSEAVVAILRRTGDWQKFKGLPAPKQPLKVAPERADRKAVYEAAAQAAAGLEAPKTPAAKPAKRTAKAAASSPSSEASPSPEAAAAPAALAEAPASSDAPAASTEAPAASTEAPAAEETAVAAGDK